MRLQYYSIWSRIYFWALESWNWQSIHNCCKTIFHLKQSIFVNDEVWPGCPKLVYVTLYDKVSHNYSQSNHVFYSVTNRNLEHQIYTFFYTWACDSPSEEPNTITRKNLKWSNIKFSYEFLFEIIDFIYMNICKMYILADI